MFKKKVIKTTLFIMLGFVLLFLFRLLYSYTSKQTYHDEEYFNNFFSDFNQSKKNYASERWTKFDKPEPGGFEPAQTQTQTQPPKETGLSQKYEKTATIQTKTEQFDEDSRKVKTEIKNFNGIIQFEQNTGNKGYRELHLLIGIEPERFDSFYTVAKSIGHLRSTDITKVDKTSEYKNLNAKKASLESMRTSLIALKEQNGKIDEYINLQNRILDIEEKLQGLGVLLGDFSEENEFCTVRFSLKEGKKPVPISLLHRLKVSFEWTVINYLQFLAVVALAVFSAFFILLVIDKLKLLVNLLKKLNEQ